MHLRRLASFLLGMWLGCSFFMALVATQNFRGVDRLLARPALGAQADIATLGHEAARALLRYQVSELNRWYFLTWDTAQLALGLLLLFLLLFGTSENKFILLLASLMLGIALVERFVLTPSIVAQGRALDFTIHQGSSPESTRFWMLHGAYSGLELLKWLLGGTLLLRFLLRRQVSGNTRHQVDMVDKPDHRHIDR